MKSHPSIRDVASVLPRAQGLLTGPKKLISKTIVVFSKGEAETESVATGIKESASAYVVSADISESAHLNIAAGLASTKRQEVAEDADASTKTHATNMHADQVPLHVSAKHAKRNINSLPTDADAEELANTRVDGSFYNGETTNLDYAVAQAKVEQRHIANSNSKQNVKLRRDMAIWAMTVVSLQLFFVNIGFLDMAGFQLRELRIVLNDKLIIAWLSTTLVQVIGIIMVVANYLYKAENLASSEPDIKASDS